MRRCRSAAVGGAAALYSVTEEFSRRAVVGGWSAEQGLMDYNVCGDISPRFGSAGWGGEKLKVHRAGQENG